MAGSSPQEVVRTRLRSSLATAGGVEEYLQSAVEHAGELTGLKGSYTLSTTLGGSLLTVASTDRDAWEADQVEFDVEDGPCVELLRYGTAHGGIDLSVERRWPAWSAVAGLLGFGSAAAVGAELDEGGQRLVLNCYSVDDTLLGEGALDRAQQFVEQVVFTIPLALELARQSTEVAHLQEALASRSTIDQALGVLMAQNQCTRDEAFGVLRRASQNRNVKLREVAAAIIHRFTGHPAAEPPAFRSPAARSRPGAVTGS